MTGPWVITGTGMVSVAGDTPDAVLSALVRGRPLSSMRDDDGFATAAIAGFDVKSRLARRGVKDLSRVSQLACAAAAGNAGGLRGVAPDDVGVVFGTAWGSVDTVIEFDWRAWVDGPRFVDPILFTETVSNIPAGQIAIFFGWSAFNATVSSGSASGLAGVHRALAFLEEGRGTVAVAGGGDALSVRVLRALRERGCWAARPDSLPLAAGRSGRVGGEGACLLTVESAASAARRAVPAMARIAATAHGFFPDDAQAARQGANPIAGLMRELLLRAGLTPRAVDAIVLSASGDRAGDASEAAAVLEVFGEGGDAPAVIAPKAILGETWGASGSLASVVGVEVIRSGVIPGAPSGFVVDPAMAGLHVPAETLRKAVRHVLVLDSSEQGHHLGIVLSAP